MFYAGVLQSRSFCNCHRSKLQFLLLVAVLFCCCSADQNITSPNTNTTTEEPKSSPKPLDDPTVPKCLFGHPLFISLGIVAIVELLVLVVVGVWLLWLRCRQPTKRKLIRTRDKGSDKTQLVTGTLRTARDNNTPKSPTTTGQCKEENSKSETSSKEQQQQQDGTKTALVQATSKTEAAGQRPSTKPEEGISNQEGTKTAMVTTASTKPGSNAPPVVDMPASDDEPSFRPVRTSMAIEVPKTEDDLPIPRKQQTSKTTATRMSEQQSLPGAGDASKMTTKTQLEKMEPALKSNMQAAGRGVSSDKAAGRTTMPIDVPTSGEDESSSRRKKKPVDDGLYEQLEEEGYEQLENVAPSSSTSKREETKSEEKDNNQYATMTDVAGASSSNKAIRTTRAIEVPSNDVKPVVDDGLYEQIELTGTSQPSSD